MITGRNRDNMPAGRWPNKILYRFSGLVIGGLFIGGLQFVILPAGADELDSTRVKQLHDSGLIVPLSDILRDAQQRYQFGHLVEAVLQQSGDALIYEIEFLDGDGELRELYYDAKTGDLRFYEIHETGSDGLLRSFRYDAITGEPVTYEFEIMDSDGKQRLKYEYNLDTRQLQPHPGEDHSDAFTAD